MKNLRLAVIDNNRSFVKAAEEYLLQRPEVNSVMVFSNLANLLQEALTYSPHMLFIDYSIIRDCAVEHSVCIQLKELIPDLRVYAVVLYPEDYYTAELSEGKLLNGFISRQNFASETKELLLEVFVHNTGC